MDLKETIANYVIWEAGPLHSHEKKTQRKYKKDPPKKLTALQSEV